MEISRGAALTLEQVARQDRARAAHRESVKQAGVFHFETPHKRKAKQAKRFKRANKLKNRF
jgi:hypothetical protein